MKTFFSCPICSEEAGNPLTSFFDGDLGDDDISTYTCPKNHTFRIMSRNDKYRILFDEAIIQLQDGFYENAILNAYTSLEEFMKFFIKFHLHILGFSGGEILNFINTIKFAENKKGAFLLSYFQMFHENNINKELSTFAELRNAIIHNGKFISEKESYNFCEAIYNFINSVLTKLNEKYTDTDYVEMSFKFQQHHRENNTSELQIVESFVAFSSILPMLGIPKTNSFEKEFNDFKTTKKYCFKNPLTDIK